MIQQNDKNSFFTSEEIEKLLLCLLLTNKEFIQQYINLFSDKRIIKNNQIKNIISIIISYYKKYNTPPTENILTNNIANNNQLLQQLSTTKDEFINIIKSSITLFNQIIDNNVIYTTVLDYLKNRKIYITLSDNIDNIEDNKTINKIIDTFNKLIVVSSLTNNWFVYNENTIIEHLDKLSIVDDKLSTGYKIFDEDFNGGILKNGKFLWVPVGMPGIGKTAFLINLMNNFYKMKKNIVVITMEINRDLYLQRFESICYNIPIYQVPDNKYIILNEYQKNKDNFGNIAIIEFPPKTVNVLTIENALNNLIISGFTPEIILIDYLNLLTSLNSSNNITMYERIGDIAKELRALGYKFNCPIISPTQFNSEGFDTVPSMKNIAESRAVAHHADVITGIWQNDNDRNMNIIRFQHLKNRLGGIINKEYLFKIDYKTLKISEIE